MKYTILSSLLLGSFVVAVPQFPKATSVREDALDGTGWSPAPTQFPIHELRNNHRLNQRQLSSGALLGWYAPDNTCGYVGGQLGGVRTCDSGYLCAAITSAFVGCCNAAQGNCQWFGTCYDSAAVAASSCDHACQQNTNNVICTASTRPYCYKYTLAGLSVSFYQCDSQSHPPTAFDTVLTTFVGQASARTWSALYNTSSASRASSVSSTRRSTSISTPTSTPTPSSDSSSTGSAGYGSATNNPSPRPIPTSSSKTPIGAIVGGVVGGIALIGAIIGLLFWRSKKNKSKAAAAAVPIVPAPSHHQDPPKQAMVQQQPPMQQGPYPPQNPHYSYFQPDPNAYPNKMPMDMAQHPVSPSSPAPPYYAQPGHPQGPSMQMGPSPVMPQGPAPYVVPSVNHAAELGGDSSVIMRDGQQVYEVPDHNARR